jgi:hypothetical protein
MMDQQFAVLSLVSGYVDEPCVLGNIKLVEKAMSKTLNKKAMDVCITKHMFSLMDKTGAAEFKGDMGDHVAVLDFLGEHSDFLQNKALFDFVVRLVFQYYNADELMFFKVLMVLMAQQEKFEEAYLMAYAQHVFKFILMGVDYAKKNPGWGQLIRSVEFVEGRIEEMRAAKRIIQSVAARGILAGSLALSNINKMIIDMRCWMWELRGHVLVRDVEYRGLELFHDVGIDRFYIMLPDGSKVYVE